MMYLELKQAILDWLCEHADTWQRVVACHDHFRPYIYGPDGNYLIGGRDVGDFIVSADKLLFPTPSAP